MSRTHKIYSHDDTEVYINRIMNELSSLDKAIGKQSNQIRREFKQNLNQRIAALNEATINREQQLMETVIGNTNSRMAEMELQHRKAIIKQAKKFNKALHQQGEAFTEQLMHQSSALSEEIVRNTDTLRMEMREQGAHLNQRINKVRNETIKMVNQLTKDVSAAFEVQGQRISDVEGNVVEIQKDLKGVWNEINTMIRKENAQVDAAVLNVESCQAIWNCLQTDTAVRKFESAKLPGLHNKLQNLIQNSMTSPQTVDALAQSARFEMLEVQESAQKQQFVFNYLYVSTLSETEALLKIMHHNRNKTFFTDEQGEQILDTEGNPVQVEVNFWANGEFSRVEKEAASIKEELTQNKDAAELSLERVEALMAKVKELEIEQANLVTTAAYRGIQSEQRVMLSEDIIGALQQKNYEIKRSPDGGVEHNYLGSEEKKTEQDPREGVFAILESPDGVEITVIVDADESNKGNQITFHRNDVNQEHPDELLRTLNFVQGALKSEDHTMTAPKAPDGIGDIRVEGLADANALKKTGLRKASKKQSK